MSFETGGIGTDVGSLMSVNYVLLSVISGVIGLVLTGFTGWHISLAARGQTTIECLEKTRYLTPLRKSMQKQQYGVYQDETARREQQPLAERLAEIHANALPGVTRIEEGEERPSPIQGDLESGLASRENGGARRMRYDELERSREQERYEDYLDEQDSERLPNAFDLGWRRNLLHLFGDKVLYWGLPICNTSGDGWHWEPSEKWLAARNEVRMQREGQWREQHDTTNRSEWEDAQRGDGGEEEEAELYSYSSERRPPPPPNERRETRNKRHYLDNTNPSISSLSSPSISSPSSTSTSSAAHSNSSGMSLKTLRRKESFDITHDGEEDEDEITLRDAETSGTENGTGNEGGGPYGGGGGGEGKRGDKKGRREGESAQEDWREWD